MKGTLLIALLALLGCSRTELPQLRTLPIITVTPDSSMDLRGLPQNLCEPIIMFMPNYFDYPVAAPPRRYPRNA